MTSVPTTPDSPISRVFGTGIRITLLAALLLTPWHFGGVLAQTHCVVLMAFLAVIPCWIYLARSERRGPDLRSPMTLLLFLALGLVGLQLVPLPPAVHALVSPRVAELRASVEPTAAAIDGALVDASAWIPATITPSLTRRYLALGIAGLIAFLIAANFMTSTRAQRWMCGLVAVNGAALAVFGIVQKLSWNGKLFWMVPLDAGGRPFSSFVNKNNAGGFLLLSLACGVGLLLQASDQLRGSRSADRSDHGKRRTRELAMLLAAVALVVLILGGVLLTQSRGAALAVTFATCLTLVLRTRGRQRLVLLGVLLAVVAAAGALLIGLGEASAVRDRLQTLTDPEALTSGRVEHWRDSVRGVSDFWAVGSGLGTYRHTQRLYETHYSDRWWIHPENQYLEVLLDCGVPGLMLLLLLIGSALWTSRQLVRRDTADGARLFADVLLFAIAGQAIQSVFDFSLFLAANLLLLAALCGAAAGRLRRLQSGMPTDKSEVSEPVSSGSTALTVTSRSLARSEGPRRKRRSRSSSRVTVVGWTALAGLSLVVPVWAVRETARAAIVDRADDLPPSLAWRDIPVSRLDRTIKRLETAVQSRPDDADVHRRLAILHVQAFRTKATDLFHSQNPATRRQTIWNRTKPVSLRVSANALIRAGDQVRLEQTRRDELVKQHLAPAATHYKRALRHCVVLGGAWMGATELSFLDSDRQQTAETLRPLPQFIPGQPAHLFSTGAMAWDIGEKQLAAAVLNRCLMLGDRYDDLIARLLADEDSALVQKTIPADPIVWLRVARVLKSVADRQELTNLLARRGLELGRTATDAAQRAWLAGAFHVLAADDAAAETSYDEALRLRPDAVAWRFEYVQVLARRGRREKAIAEAERCVREAPENRSYSGLLEELRKTP